MTLLDPTLLLYGLDWQTLFAMLWFVLLLDLPRYTLGFLAVALAEVLPREPAAALSVTPVLISVVLAGHNEGAVVRRCVRSLREQSYRRLEIICIDDGSVDGMGQELHRLRAAGLIDAAFTTHVRGGKSSAINLGISRARGAFVVIADCDCTFDRDAIEHLLMPFADPHVGAVCANIGTRNHENSLLAGLQGLEYMLSMSLGRRVLDMFGQVSCASGALSMFRTDALRSIGGLDVGPGEDLDLTLRLRIAGWTTRFAEKALCLTDVPEGLRGFLRQRLRWERDAIRLRLRKHRHSINPLDRRCRLGDLFHQLEFLFSHVGLALIFPFYLLWLLRAFGTEAATVLVLVTMIYALLDGLAALSALIVYNRPGHWHILPLAVVYGPFNAYVMRLIRLIAYIQEWVFDRSYWDDFVPRRVAAEAPWQ